MKNRKTPCPPKQYGSGGLMEASLLCLLKEGNSYGYNLMEKLSQFGFQEDSVNISVIYRNLRNMEKRGQITSSWVKSEQGPDKRVYSITKSGLMELENWILLLEEKREMMALLIKKFENLK